MHLPPRPLKRANNDAGVQFAWDSTSIKATLKCPRYYAYSILWGFSPKGTSVHLAFGGLYATALENFYKLRAEGLSHDDALRSVVREAMLATWDADESRAIDWGDSKKTRSSLIRTIVWYLEEFGDESEQALKTYHLADGTPAVELSFSFQMTDDIVLCGHLDRVSIFDDQKWVVDQKTTGQTLSDYWARNFNPDTQFTLYSLAGKIVLDEPVRGVIVDGAQIAVGFSRFQRFYSMRTQAQIDDWWHGTEHIIAVTQHLTERAKSPDDFPMNTESCGNYGGCAFRAVCSAAPRIRPNILATDFTQRVWDPLEAR